MAAQLRPILLKGHERSVTHLQFSSGCDILFSASKSYEPTAWFADSGERGGTYKGHNGVVWKLDVTEDTALLLTCSADNTARLWEVETGVELAKLQHTAGVRVCGFSPDDTKFFTITDSVMNTAPMIQIFNRAADIADQALTPHTVYTPTSGPRVKIHDGTWAGNELYTVCDDGSVRVYDLETGKCVRDVIKHNGPISRLNFDKYGATFVTASKDGSAKLFDAKTLKVLKVYETGRPVNCAVISPIQEHIIMGGGEASELVTTSKLDSSQFKIRFFHQVYENEIASVAGHFGTLNTIAVSPDGKSFASGAEDGYIRLHHLPEDYARSVHM